MTLDKSKQKIVERHLPYEVDMLRGTYRLLGATPPTDDVVKNALIESFCVHARSLLDFFECKPKKDDDYVATDFSDSFKTRIDQSVDPLKLLRINLNKEIFHLTRERKDSEADQFNMDTDGKQLIQVLEQEIYRFGLCLPAEFKCESPPVTSTETYLFEGATNTTSVVSHMIIVGSRGPA